MNHYTNTAMKNESLDLNGYEAGEETLGSPLLELCQQKVIFLPMVKSTVILHILKPSLSEIIIP